MKNLLLISLDTLRADVAYSGRFPALNRLRRESVTFLNAVSSAPLTPPSHATIMTGHQPYMHGIRHLYRETLSPHTPTLAQLLKVSGYNTGAVVSCPGLNRFYGMGKGFDHYDDEIPLLPDGRNPLHVVDVKLRGTALKRADLVVDRSIAWLEENQNQPFFLFMHTFDAHWPYEAPETPAIPVENAYEGEVAFVDRHLDRLLSWMGQRNLLDDTLIVCLSDHGEDLGGWYVNDHAGECGHPEEEGHGALLFEATQQVPLLIRIPGSNTPKEIAEQVRLVDVAPTILDLLNISAPPMAGQSLRPFLEGGLISSEMNVAYFETFFREELARNNSEYAHFHALRGVRINGRYKVIWEHGGDHVEVYDLAEDQNERRPVIFSPWQPLLSEKESIYDVAVLNSLTQDKPFSGKSRMLLEVIAVAVQKLGNIDLVVAKSVFENVGISHSDIVIEVVCDTPCIRSTAKELLARTILEAGSMLSSFSATNIQNHEVMIYFIAIDDALIKLDIHFLLPDSDTLLLDNVRLVGRPGAMAPSAKKVQAVDQHFSDLFADIYNKFVGWMWIAHQKIQNGDYWAADVVLSEMRNVALLPLLRFARGLPLDGRQDIEKQLGRFDLKQLDATRIANHDPVELSRVLITLCDSIQSISPTVAAKLGKEFRTADLARMKIMVVGGI